MITKNDLHEAEMHLVEMLDLKFLTTDDIIETFTDLMNKVEK